MIYRLRSFGPDRKIIAVQRLSAAGDAEAMETFHNMMAGASAVAWFDLYEGERHVGGAAPYVQRAQGRISRAASPGNSSMRRSPVTFGRIGS